MGRAEDDRLVIAASQRADVAQHNLARLRIALREQVATWRRLAEEADRLKDGMVDAPAHWAGADMRSRVFSECADAIELLAGAQGSEV